MLEISREMQSWFPAEIVLVGKGERAGEKMIVSCMAEIPQGESFRVLRVRVNSDEAISAHVRRLIAKEVGKGDTERG